MDNLDTTDIELILELMRSMYIQSMRNYDMLAIIADKLGADAKGLSNLHEQGQVLAPPPSFIYEDTEQDSENQLDLFDNEANK
jgi:hypothetical protein